MIVPTLLMFSKTSRPFKWISKAICTREIKCAVFKERNELRELHEPPQASIWGHISYRTVTTSRDVLRIHCFDLFWQCLYRPCCLGQTELTIIKPPG